MDLLEESLCYLILNSMEIPQLNSKRILPSWIYS
jgi:hypothetical protein